MSRRVLVTGASRGIGRAIATQLGRQGFAVGIGYREQREAAEAVLEEIEDASGEGTLLQLDVADRDDCAQRLAADLEANGPYWGVVCNAGITRDAAFPAMKAEAWDQVIQTNLGGFYNVLHPLIMPMVRAKEGGRRTVKPGFEYVEEKVLTGPVGVARYRRAGRFPFIGEPVVAPNPEFIGERRALEVSRFTQGMFC